MSAIPADVLALLSTKDVIRLRRKSLRKAIQLRNGGYVALPQPFELNAINCEAELVRRNEDNR